MKTTFYFVRHGETTRNTKGKLPDGLNDPLNERGETQAAETASHLPKDIDIIISSPLMRAVQTGSIIRDLREYKSIIEEKDIRLTEVNFESLGGKTWDQVMDLHPVMDLKEKYRLQEYDFSGFNGDSYESVRSRLFSFINEVKEKYPGKKILVPTHAGIIRCLYKSERNHAFDEAPPNASIHEFCY